MSVIHDQSQQSTEAVNDFNRATELDSDYAQAYYNRGEVYCYRMNNFIQGRQDLKQAADLFFKQRNVQLSNQTKKILEQL